ncbi:hypothetical protein AB835_08790 [Candidatus Endobugula sertula]|uniref:AB hydrolase-1 domain-containing protein n=1 Tax=Candidatus Endobugula sertula TaxID=62101 RepID=A0A1D2QPE1_9GAMM|nr:hypothetical protein AB835_08790 [Candidatus Endobugula sertula]
MNGFTYAAQLWGSQGDLPIIALHGWLDNSASFDVLAPHLTSVQCLALDLAGHGFSDQKEGLSDYPLWAEVSVIYEIADQMGWQQFGLLGHSRGSMMALISAGVYAERISHLIMIDALLPPVVDPDKAPEHMMASLEEIRRRVNREVSLYPTYEDAITARCFSRFAPVNQRTAKILATRGLSEVDGRFHWHADGKLWASSNVALSADMLWAFINRISAPVLLLLGSRGLMTSIQSENTVLQRHHQAVKKLSATVLTFDDGHFLHMENSVKDVAQSIRQFLLANHKS